MAGLFVVAAMLAVYKHEKKDRSRTKKQHTLTGKDSEEERLVLTGPNGLIQDDQSEVKIDVGGWSELNDMWRPEPISYSTSIVNATGGKQSKRSSWRDGARKQLLALQLY